MVGLVGRCRSCVGFLLRCVDLKEFEVRAREFGERATGLSWDLGY